MFQKILIPLDGSPLAETALAHVQRMAPAGTAELVLITVIETYRYGYSATDIAFNNTLHYVRESTGEYLAQQQSKLEAQQYTVQIYAVEGDAAQGILDVAEETGADLIAMTTHGRAGVMRWALGSVAERVLQEANIPVWLVRESTRIVPPEEMERILVPLDGTEAATQALAQARQLAQHTGAELLLLRAIPDMDGIDSENMFNDEPTAQQTREMWRTRAEEYLAEVAQDLAAANISSRTLVVQDDPAHAVFQTAAAENVDCIVMATHARYGLNRLLYGSVADDVLRHIDCPLLLVHAHEWPTPKAEAQQLTPV